MLTAQAEAEIRARHEALQAWLEQGGVRVTSQKVAMATHADRAVLLAHVKLLGDTLRSVCEDAFSKEECPAQCDSYGHAEECGAVSAAAHARNLTTRLAYAEQAVRRLRVAATELQRWGRTPDTACWCHTPPFNRVHSPGCQAMQFALAATAGVS